MLLQSKSLKFDFFQCPESVQTAVEKRRKQQKQSGQDNEVNPTETPTYKSLVRLHQNLIKVTVYLKSSIEP